MFEHDNDKADDTPRVAKHHVEQSIRIIQGHRVQKENQRGFTKSKAYEQDSMG